MRFKVLRAFSLIGFLFLWQIEFAQSQSENTQGFFSAQAFLTDAGKCAVSPDREKRVCVELLDDNAEDFPAAVTLHTATKSLKGTIRYGLNAQVLWSPDSKSFAVTGSVVGANGQYNTDVFVIHPGRLSKIRLTALIERAFGHPVKCQWPEPPNVAAVKWLIPSRKLLLAAEIMHHSNCDSFGTFKAYAVDLAERRVVRVYGQLETKRLFGNELGDWLRNANDNCIRDPRSCVVGAERPSALR